ncbi:LOW QUALITY PROTEIN: secreted protein, partial [Streptomyces viridosporus ATCC 14672]
EQRTEDHRVRGRPGRHLRHGLRHRPGLRPGGRGPGARTRGATRSVTVGDRGGRRPRRARDPSVGGLRISEDGYALELKTPHVTAADRTDLRFTVRDEEGRPVTGYRREHDEELHLIVASRDLLTYRHLHPTRAADGTWTAPVELPRAGGYRVRADSTLKPRPATSLSPGRGRG